LGPLARQTDLVLL